MDTFSLGGVIRQTRRIFGLHPIGFLVFAIAVVAIPTVLGSLFLAPRVIALRVAATGGQTPSFATFSAILLLEAAPTIVAYLGSLVLTGTVAAAAWRDVEGRPAVFGASLRAGITSFLPLLLLSILAYLGISLGSLLLVIPGMILAFMWIVTKQVYIIERPGFTAAFGRSRYLTAGYRWRLFGITLLYLLVFGVIIGVLTFLSGLIIGEGGGSPNTPLLWLLQVVFFCVNGVFSLVSATGLAAIYIELRRTKDGYLSRDLVDAFT